MEDAFKPYTLIQSYVLNRWFVSTALRRSSAWNGTPYFETIAWEWDSKTKERGKIVAQGAAWKIEAGGMKEHFRVINDLIQGTPDPGEEA